MNPVLIWKRIVLCGAVLASPSLAAKFRANFSDYYQGTPTEYSSHFQDALNDLWTNGGGVLEINPGKYQVCNPVNFSPSAYPAGFSGDNKPTITIRGTGGESKGVYIYCMDGFATSAIQAYFHFGNQPATYIGYTVDMENLSIEGGANVEYRYVTGIMMTGLEKTIHIKDVQFRMLRQGFRPGMTQYIVDRCKFSNIKEYGINGSEGGDASINRSEFAAIGCNGPCNTYYTDISSAAIYLGGNTTVSENVIGSCAYAALKLHTDDGHVTIVNNEIDNGRYVLLYERTSGPDANPVVQFSANKIRGWPGITNFDPKTHTNPPMMGFVKGKYLTGLMVKNNHFAGLAQNGIGFDIENADDVQITGNTFSPNWIGTWSPLLGTLVKFTNVATANISGNRLEIGLRSPSIRPLIAQFSNSKGLFSDNQIAPGWDKTNGVPNAGYCSGIAEDGLSRFVYTGNIGLPDNASVFSDANGWRTVPDRSEILVADYFGGAALRKSLFTKTVVGAFSSGTAKEALRIRVPLPASNASTLVGGNLKVRIFVRESGGDRNAIIDGEITVSDYYYSGGGIPGGPVINLKSLTMNDIHGQWALPQLTFSTDQADPRVKIVNLQVNAPGNANYQAALRVEYEEWGGLKLK